MEKTKLHTCQYYPQIILKLHKEIINLKLKLN